MGLTFKSDEELKTISAEAEKLKLELEAKEKILRSYEKKKVKASIKRFNFKPSELFKKD